MSQEVAAEFVREFRGSEGYDAVVVPDICGVLRSTREAVFDGGRSNESWRRAFVELHGREPLREEEEGAELASPG